MDKSKMVNVIITGSTKGIGFGLAREFASQGHQVVINGSSEESVNEALQKLKTQLPEKAQQIVGFACNVSNSEEMKELWQYGIKNYGTIDIWINNAGLARTAWSIIDIPQTEIETMVTSNMLGTINGCRIAAQGMLEQNKSGKIFNMLGGGSDGEYFPGMGIYGSTKRGLNYLTDALTKELKDTNIIVGKIRPGMVITEAVVREAKQDPERFEKSRAIMNNMVDQVETVAPFIVEQILSTSKSGQKIAWLNGKKIALRMMKSKFKPREDQFARFGL